MYILISNDDGYQAEGILALAARLGSVARVTVIAPERDRSGASNSLTLEDPIRVSQVEADRYRVQGTPTDCVHVALTGFLEQDPDMVFSGINAGANLGDDVLYSGTVAAAMEGRYLGLPAVAISLAGGPRPIYFDSAARVALKLLEQIQDDPLPVDTILNVNVPDLPWDEIQGLHATRLGSRHRAEAVIKEHDPRGRPIYWIGPPGSEQDSGPGTDFYAVRNGYVSVTPIQVDLTRYSALEQVSGWLAGIKV
ncbi:5'/3'-nucleotidase SurE [Halorhodospira halochloris]|uniref:5'-nucleotidase SurE n=1 Tax=Halorhodospira halochloris TaxID=1052 RepID=A0A0X8X8E6_HALHR|nr:5'/3'-nucleotidase SurE [Halorhodospira halochloris]MBK1651208.1 5'/3'-nucleotidase SurE [Halorhodospira halochloris]MCG5530721.1 5'/3'-nucleotidase SurE [Halorhodospira halochloris]MCG5547647.1 5'/3'-nucleotidase SurE [Halorhodospira halochloris]BAU57480.1 5-nucleotidase SurE [Halorhodospira halochloris]